MGESKVIVAGCGQTKFDRRKDGTGFRDWAVEAFTSALDMAGLERVDVEALFVASESDFFSLQLNPSAVLATDLGVIGVPAMRCEGGGASGQLAVHAGVQAIASGAAKHVAVVGVDPSASSLPGETMRSLYGFSFDAQIDGATGISATALYALSWQLFARKWGLGDDALAHVTRQNRANACHNPDAHLPLRDTEGDIAESAPIALPYRRLHCSPLSDGAAAVILSHADHVPANRKHAPRVAGIGAATDHVHLGARHDAGRFTAKGAAMKRACGMSGHAPRDVGLVEVYDSYAGAQLQGLAALGLSEDLAADLGDGPGDGAFAPGGRCPVNLSGGLMGQGAPVGAVGVSQVGTCARILEGRYHNELQPQSPPFLALADTHGGVCTTAAVTLLQTKGAA